jgi:hypothetical protein
MTVAASPPFAGFAREGRVVLHDVRWDGRGAASVAADSPPVAGGARGRYAPLEW